MGTIVGFVSAWAGSGESPAFSWFVSQSRPTFLKKISSTQYSYSQEAALDIFRTTFILFPVSSSTPADSAAASLLCRQPSLFSRSLSLIPYKLLCIHPSSIFLISSTCTYLDSLSVSFGSWRAKGMETFLTSITRRGNITFPSTGIVSVTSEKLSISFKIKEWALKTKSVIIDLLHLYHFSFLLSDRLHLYQIKYINILYYVTLMVSDNLIEQVIPFFLLLMVIREEYCLYPT